MKMTLYELKIILSEINARRGMKVSSWYTEPQSYGEQLNAIMKFDDKLSFSQLGIMATMIGRFYRATANSMDFIVTKKLVSNYLKRLG